MDKLKNETCKAIKLRSGVEPYEPKVSEENKQSSEVEKNSGKEVVVEKEVEKKFEGEKKGY